MRDHPVQASVNTCSPSWKDIVRIEKLTGTSLAVACLGLTVLAGAAFAGNLDTLLGDWDLNIVKSKFEPQPPMKKYTMRVINAGTGHLLIKSDWIGRLTALPVTWSTPPAIDGKPISLIDYPLADTVTDTMVNTTTWKSVWTKDGKIVEREVQTISRGWQDAARHGLKVKIKHGRKFKNRLVFEEVDPSNARSRVNRRLAMQ